jgi:hypothetical protein
MTGRFASESVADFNRNGWPNWIGISGRFGAESPIGCHLFDIIAFHSDEDTGDFYGLTFTNDKLWQEKMQKDFNDMAAKQDHAEGQ